MYSKRYPDLQHIVYEAARGDTRALELLRHNVPAVRTLDDTEAYAVAEAIVAYMQAHSHMTTLLEIHADVLGALGALRSPRVVAAVEEVRGLQTLMKSIQTQLQDLGVSLSLFGALRASL